MICTAPACYILRIPCKKCPKKKLLSEILNALSSWEFNTLLWKKHSLYVGTITLC